MKWENENIQGMVKHINDELEKGRKINDIGISDFNVNYKVVKTRLEKEGYLMSNNKFIKADELKNKEQSTTNEIPVEINFEKLIELQNLIEPLKELLKEKENLKSSELPTIRYLDITQKTFKVDSEILSKWLSFCKSKKGYKMQDLTSKALAEYMERHGW